VKPDAFLFSGKSVLPTAPVFKDGPQPLAEAKALAILLPVVEPS
jgi:hypothetical protein